MSKIWRWAKQHIVVAMAHVPGTCAVCLVTTSKKCVNCEKVYYCCRDHQKNDWKTHKNKCPPFKLQTNSEIGRYFVATRKIPANQEIIHEWPLVTGPLQKTPPICLSCYKALSELNAIKCIRCGWPMCSVVCANSPNHTPECEITVNSRKKKVSITTFGVNHPSYEAVAVLRCIYMKSKNSLTWEKINSLQSDVSNRKYDDSYEQDKRNVAQFILDYFNVDEVSEEQIMKILGVFNINGHEVPFYDHNAVSLFENCSYLEHNCRANCSKSFGNDRELIIRSATTINPGEHLSICYTDPLWGTVQRQKHLLLTKYFHCSCDRCTDKSQRENCFNSIKCFTQGCNNDIVINGQPNLQGWNCSKCGTIISKSNVENFLEFLCNLFEVHKNDSKTCDNFIKNHKDILHDEHFLIVKAKISLVGLYSQCLQSLTNIELQRQINIIESLYNFITSCIPAETRCRGILLYYQYIFIRALERRTPRNLVDSAERPMESNSKKHEDLLKISLLLLESEPINLPEGQLAVRVKNLLQNN